MKSLSFSQLFSLLFVSFSTLLIASYLSAWSGPLQFPPSGNTPAPINVGTASQVKDGTIGVDGLAVFGNTIFSGSNRYANFGTTAGLSGYGFRDNSGTLEYKNSGGSWAPFGSSSGGGSGGSGALPQTSCTWTPWFRLENGTSPQIAPTGSYIAGIDYRALTGGPDGVMRFYHCSST